MRSLVLTKFYAFNKPEMLMEVPHISFKCLTLELGPLLVSYCDRLIIQAILDIFLVTSWVPPFNTLVGMVYMVHNYFLSLKFGYTGCTPTAYYRILVIN